MFWKNKSERKGWAQVDERLERSNGHARGGRSRGDEPNRIEVRSRDASDSRGRRKLKCERRGKEGNEPNRIGLSARDVLDKSSGLKSEGRGMGKEPNRMRLIKRDVLGL